MSAYGVSVPARATTWFWAATLFAVTSGFTSGCQRHGSAAPKASSSIGTSQAFARRADALRRVKELEQIYVSSRDAAFLGKGGLVEQAASVRDKSLVWTTDVQALAAVAGSGSQSSASAVQASLESHLVAEQQLLAEVARAVTALGQGVSALRAKLAAAPRVSYPIEGYEVEYQDLIRAVDLLDRSAADLGTAAAEHVAKLQAAAPALAQALRAKFVRALAQSSGSELQQAIQAVDDLDAATAALEPLEREVQRDYLTANSLYTAGRIFRLGEVMSRLNASCTTAQDAVQVLTIKDQYKQASRLRLAGLCQQAQDNFASLPTDASGIASLVADATDDRLARAATACAAGPSRWLCGMYSWLGRIKHEQVAAMDTGMLKILELALDQMEQDGGV